MNIRKANINDVQKILDIIDKCENFMISYGCEQWSYDTKPTKDNICFDINRSSGYVLTDDNNDVAGYMSLLFGEEPLYNVIKQGRWDSNYDYATIHRLALDDSVRGQGLSKIFFDFAEQECIRNNIRSIRIDTHKLNAPMKSILKKRKYKKCGVIYINDKERDAYEKIVIPFLVGDVIQLKKSHPCGNDVFKILRIGMDFRLECEKCKSQIWLSRTNTSRRLKKRL